MMNNIDTGDNLLITEINRLKREFTWQQIGDMIGISRAHAWRVGHGKSDSIKARIYFGIPLKQVQVVPCSKCGGLHQQKKCKGSSRKRHYVVLEFDSDEEKQEMLQILRDSASSRKAYSKDLLQTLKFLLNAKI